MKIKLQDIKPNPYRDFNFCPIDKKKVDALVGSMEQTGFWDNVVVRPHPTEAGKYQQAYGHNRLIAAAMVFGDDYEVDIPVRNLSDEVMLQMMANENMEYWAATPAVIDETVRQAKRFLEYHPEVAVKYGQVKKSVPVGTNLIGKSIIARFLNWNEHKVADSLERLNLIDTGEIEPETIAMFDTEGSARTFITTLKEEKIAGTPIPKEKHREYVEKFKDAGNSKQRLKDIIIDDKYTAPPKKKRPEDDYIPKIENIVSDLNLKIEEFRDGLKTIRIIYDEIGGVPDAWDGFNWHAYLIDNLNRITSEINIFINNNKTKKLPQ